MIQRICRALRPLAILLWKPEPRGRLESKLTAQSHTQFKPTPIGFARSRRFGPDSIREKRPAAQEKIAGHYINHNFLLPIDLETYRKLKNHISKALVPLLQVWLFASHKAGSFEKRYDELCEILNLQKYKAPSLITRQFKPSLDELTTHG